VKESAEITEKGYTPLSPYVKIVRKDVRFAAHRDLETYHGIAGNDYVCMVAVTRDGRVPLVRQFRPIIERYTWELPAGTIDAGESPAESGIRELKEETGFVCSTPPVDLGRFAADTGRLEIWAHGFFFPAVEKDRDWAPEPDVECALFSPHEIPGLIQKGEFPHLMHVAYLYLSKVLKG
jgi:ADP-ribose pyrophosphatase